MQLPMRETLGHIAATLSWLAFLKRLPKDLLGGIWLTFERPFSASATASRRGYYGEVKDIALRATTINTLDDSMVSIPTLHPGSSISNANPGENNCMVVTSLWLPIAVDVLKFARSLYEAVISSLSQSGQTVDRPFDHFRDRLATVVEVKAMCWTASTKSFSKAMRPETGFCRRCIGAWLISPLIIIFAKSGGRNSFCEMA